MQISVTFDPAKDLQAAVHAAVEAAYGKPQTGNGAPVQVTAQPTAVESALQHSQATAPAQDANPLQPGVTPSTVPTQPVTSGSATVTTPAGVELDSTGLPWDARIHSSGVDENGKHKKTAKGVWNKKKGCTDTEFDQVSKELMTLMAANPATNLPAAGVLGNPTNHPHQVAVPVPGQPDQFTVVPATAPQAQAPVAPAAMAPVGESAPVMAAAPVVTQPAPVSPGGIAPMPTLAPMPTPTPIAPHDFTTLAQWIAPQMEATGGKLKPEHVEHFCRQCGIVDAQGVGQFALVINRPDAVAWLHQAFVQQIAAMG